jgi:acetoin utilization deacetylase AcuC-like enzyme
VDDPSLAAERLFDDELLLVSAGFDGHQDDPLGPLRITDGGFEQLLDRLAAWARDLCGGRWLAALEGGYDLPALSRGMVALAERLLVGPARGSSLAKS